MTTVFAYCGARLTTDLINEKLLFLSRCAAPYVEASALESRWEDVGALLREVAGSFRVPQAELL